LHPYDIAYLRGGAGELLKLRLFELVHAGYLVVHEDRIGRKTEWRLAVSPECFQDKQLEAMDRYLIKEFKKPLTAEQILNLDFPDDLAALCREARQKLIDSGLLTGRMAADDALPQGIIAAVAMLLFFSTAIVTHMVFGESFVAIAITMVVVILGPAFFGASFGYRRTASGTRCLRDMQDRTSRAQAAIRMGLPLNDDQLWAVAVHGASILATTELDAFAVLFSDVRAEPFYGTKHAGRYDSGCG
jgi:uncharacterized protein (TIGR04222 family)